MPRHCGFSSATTSTTGKYLPRDSPSEPFLSCTFSLCYEFWHRVHILVYWPPHRLGVRCSGVCWWSECWGIKQSGGLKFSCQTYFDHPHCSNQCCFLSISNKTLITQEFDLLFQKLLFWLSSFSSETRGSSIGPFLICPSFPFST